MHLLLRGIAQPDWPSLTAALHDSDLDSPRRSTIPLVAYWNGPTGKVAWLQTHLAFPATTPLTLSFEHSVEVACGSGKPSCTDLMILAPSITIAIEAKYTEPPSDPVGKWLGPSPSQNRRDVLNGWLAMIRTGTGLALTDTSVLSLPYQLIHRAASACSLSARHRAVVYQLFDPGRRDYYVETLRALRALVPKTALTLALLDTPATASTTYSTLLVDWDHGKRKMANAVRSAMVNGSTFEFNDLEITNL